MKMEYFRSSVFLARCVLIFAYDDLSKHKVATQSTTYSSSIYTADNAVDRNITTCMRTNEIGLNSPNKTVWWKVDLGGVYNIYSVNVLFKNYYGHEIRQRGRFAGFSLLVSDTATMENSSLCYKDGPLLPPLNFTSTCITSGRYVTFYNERLIGDKYPYGYENESVYTELCEVIVHGCRASGVYGVNCTERCPTYCRDNLCHIQKGTCFGCVSGWMDTTCNTSCTNGFYGVDCTQKCSGHCKDNAVCNHVTGQCDDGCAAGWRGLMCDKVCKNETYGFDCVHNCSGNCLSDSPCNKQNGHCDKGCKPGYIYSMCNKHCPSRYYGNNCEKACSGHCWNNSVCDYIDGTCSFGCQTGYIGKLCNDSCSEGYYGKNCSHVCSSNCRTCNPTDGTCNCYPGWMGSNCNIEIKEDNKRSVSSTLPAVIGGTLGACIILIVSAIMVMKRRKRLCMSGTTASPYAEVELRQTEDSAYQQLNVTGLGSDNSNRQQNISEIEPGNTYQQLNVSVLQVNNTSEQLSESALHWDSNYQQQHLSGLVFDNVYQNLSLN
ncbi:uncharacterized protein LOC111116900 [Crassostrea virginica]